MLSLGDRRMWRRHPRGLEARRALRRAGREHFSWERWNEALEAAGVPKERHLRQKDLKETLPWDVVDAFIRKPFLVVEWKKALKEMDTDDCKWGHCYACGVPGDGEDTVLANPLPKDFDSASDGFSDGNRAAAAPSLARAPRRRERIARIPFEENLLPLSRSPLRLHRESQGRGVPHEGDAGPPAAPRAADGRRAASRRRSPRPRGRTASRSRSSATRGTSRTATSMDVLERALPRLRRARPLHGGLQPAPPDVDGPGAARSATSRGTSSSTWTSSTRSRRRTSPP